MFRVNAPTANTPRAFTVVVNSSAILGVATPTPTRPAVDSSRRNRAISDELFSFRSHTSDPTNDVVEMSSESCASPRRQRSAISTLVKSDLDPVESSKIREYRRGVPVRNANLPRIEATRLLTHRIATPSRQYFSAISGRSIAN